MKRTSSKKTEKQQEQSSKLKSPKKSLKSKKPKVEQPKKLTLAEKQEIKLQRQKERQAKRIAAGEIEPKNKDRFYCTNKDLQAELIKWRDSAEKPEDRIISEELGKMMIMIADKLLNHSSFRNYPLEVKQDLRSLGLLKLIRGLKNYNFKFNNAFAYFTQALWNSYITGLTKHYKQINIKREMMKKLFEEIETYSGIDPRSSLNRCIKAYIDGDDGSGGDESDFAE